MLPEQILRLGSKEMFLNQVKNNFALRAQILLPKSMFPSLATQRKMPGNDVSATMFPSLARPLYWPNGVGKLKLVCVNDTTTC